MQQKRERTYSKAIRSIRQYCAIRGRNMLFRKLTLPRNPPNPFQHYLHNYMAHQKIKHRQTSKLSMCIITKQNNFQFQIIVVEYMTFLNILVATSIEKKSYFHQKTK